MVSHSGPHILFTAFVLTLLSVGCGQSQSSQGSAVNDPWGIVTIKSGKAIRIGVALSNTDSQSENAEAARGIELAIQHFQTLNGFPLEIVPVSVACSEAEGQAAANELVSDASVVAVIGPDCSAACQSSARVFDEAHFTAISPSCTASDLADPFLHSGAFLRTILPDTREGYLAAQYAHQELGARRVAIIEDGSPETRGAADAFETRMASLGVKVLRRDTITPGSVDMQTTLDAIARQGKIDLVYAPLLAGDASTMLLNRHDHAELTELIFLGGRHYFSKPVVSTAGQDAVGIYAIGPYITTEPLYDADTAYQSLYKQEPPSLSYAYAYDAVGILIEALGRTAARGDRGSLFVGRKALQDEIYKTVNYSGLTGLLTCSAWGDCGSENLAAFQLQSGTWQIVYAP